MNEEDGFDDPQTLRDYLLQPPQWDFWVCQHVYIICPVSPQIYVCKPIAQDYE